jgi:hypothetical protein
MDQEELTAHIWFEKEFVVRELNSAFSCLQLPIDLLFACKREGMPYETPAIRYWYPDW